MCATGTCKKSGGNVFGGCLSNGVTKAARHNDINTNKYIPIRDGSEFFIWQKRVF